MSKKARGSAQPPKRSAETPIAEGDMMGTGSDILRWQSENPLPAPARRSHEEIEADLRREREAYDCKPRVSKRSKALGEAGTAKGERNPAFGIWADHAESVGEQVGRMRAGRGRCTRADAESGDKTIVTNDQVNRLRDAEGI